LNLAIKKIRLKELEEFINSKSFHDFEFIPISPIRAKSYLANPHSNPDDIVLYLGFVDKQLVAFRSLFADVVWSKNEQIRFAWCSGNWVHTNHRRQGFSEALLMEAYQDWNQKLMFTNYAPNSEKLYLKTGLFKAIHQFEGVRAYLIPKTKKIFAKAKANLFYKFIFSVIDLLISVFANFRLWFYSGENHSSIKFKTMQFPDKECYELIGKNTSAFKRGKNELKWIFGNPWISSNQTEHCRNYPFSSYSNSFYYKTVKLFFQNKLVGFFIFSVREGHLKTLYFNLPDEFLTETAPFIKDFSKQNKIEFATIYKKGVATELFKRKFPFLHLKKYGQKIYSTFEINDNTDFHFQDGDGDVIFT